MIPTCAYSCWWSEVSTTISFFAVWSEGFKHFVSPNRCLKNNKNEQITEYKTEGVQNKVF
jgi:hypothetical protein